MSSALVAVLKSHSPLLLERQVVKLDRLYEEMPLNEFFSESNVAQLAFQFGYLSIENGSFNASERTVILRPPNPGVIKDIQQRIAQSKFLDPDVARQIKKALKASDWASLEQQITRLSREFEAKMKRLFANEAELHSWASTWVAAINDVGDEPVFVVQELRGRIDGDPEDNREIPRFDSFLYWGTGGADKHNGVLIEWGFDAGATEAKLEALVKKKVKQVVDNEYVLRARTFQDRNHQRVDKVEAIAVVLGKNHSCVVRPVPAGGNN
jgi:hypothetical protein